VLGVRRWREMMTDRKKRTLFNRPCPTAGCSVNGRRRRMVKLVTATVRYERNITAIPRHVTVKTN
jgi:hypothetical protein